MVEFSIPRYRQKKRPPQVPRSFPSKTHYCTKRKGRGFRLNPLALLETKLVVYRCRLCKHELWTTLDPREARALTEVRADWLAWAKWDANYFKSLPY